jgi:hypothetical protein
MWNILKTIGVLLFLCIAWPIYAAGCNYNGGEMKIQIKHGLIVIVCMALLVGPVFAKECKDCPPDKPCVYIEPASDGCNTCAGETWCVDDRWYSKRLKLCTNLHCIKPFEIKNPFKEPSE